MAKKYNELTQELIDEIVTILKEKRINILNELINFNQDNVATNEQLYIIEEIIFRIDDRGSYFVHSISEKLKKKAID